MIRKQNNSPSINKYFKVQIKTLQNAPRDADVGSHFESKRREKQYYAIETHLPSP
jgi:hypothetical protein